jgi:uncharacterized protein (DUF2062 family)
MLINILSGLAISSVIAAVAASLVWYVQRRREITEMLTRYEQQMQTVTRRPR